MNSIDNLLNMIVTEVIESDQEYRRDNSIYMNNEKGKLPPIKYNLELIERPDGSLYWVE